MGGNAKVTAPHPDPQVNDWQRNLDRIGEVMQSAEWDSKKYKDRAAILEAQVKWDGFDVEQRFDVMENILQGKDRSRWLEGVETTEAKAARENAIWEEAARRGNGSANSEPYIRSEWISYAEETVLELKRVTDYVRLDDDKVTSERWEQPEGGFQRLGGWDRLTEADRLSAIMSSNATRMLDIDDTRSLLRRHIDFDSVPLDDQRRRMGEVLPPQAERLSDATDSLTDEPSGIHQIWHRHGDGFQHVASVEGNYMAAVVLPMLERGHPAAERLSWLIDDARATDLGDKIVDPLGKAYELYSPDFGGLALRETTMPVTERPPRMRADSLELSSQRAEPDFRADVFDALMSRLEALGDELAQQARTKQQKALAEAFGELVGEAHRDIAYIAEASRQYGPPAVDLGTPAAAARVTSPADLAEGNGGASQQQDRGHTHNQSPGLKL
jgi:hypothetical protein